MLMVRHIDGTQCQIPHPISPQHSLSNCTQSVHMNTQTYHVRAMMPFSDDTKYSLAKWAFRMCRNPSIRLYAHYSRGVLHILRPTECSIVIMFRMRFISHATSNACSARISHLWTYICGMSEMITFCWTDFGKCLCAVFGTHRIRQTTEGCNRYINSVQWPTDILGCA